MTKLLLNKRIKLLFVGLLASVGLILVVYDLFISKVYINISSFNDLSIFNPLISDYETSAQNIQMQTRHVNVNNSTINVNNDDNRTMIDCKPIKQNAKQFQVRVDDEVYPKRVPLFHNTTLDFECLNSSKNIKTILMWTKFKGSPLIDYGFGVGKPFEAMNCPVTNCELTEDRTKFGTSQLVLFHLRNNIDYIPTRSNSNQRYVHVIYESPVNCHLCTKYENTFNYTATYREDSHFSSVYWTDSNLYWSDEDNDEKVLNDKSDEDIYSTKKKFSANLASNCGSNSLREEYIKELSKYVSVDVYGKCGSFKCPDNVNCRQYISENYKFFYAFENSLCYGYVTEKLFDTLNFNIIPVVFGLANYSFYIPKSGYINVVDFQSPKHLADYLTYLDNNKTAYNSYFKWKKYIRVSKKKSTGGYLCEMCIQLNLEEKLAYVGKKSLQSAQKMYGLNENCLDVSFYTVKYLNISSLTRNIFSYYMSPER